VIDGLQISRRILHQRDELGVVLLARQIAIVVVVDYAALGILGLPGLAQSNGDRLLAVGDGGAGLRATAKSAALKLAHNLVHTGALLRLGPHRPQRHLTLQLR
jgi:hypothetical protein